MPMNERKSVPEVDGEDHDFPSYIAEVRHFRDCFLQADSVLRYAPQYAESRWDATLGRFRLDRSWGRATEEFDSVEQFLNYCICASHSFKNQSLFLCKDSRCFGGHGAQDALGFLNEYWSKVEKNPYHTSWGVRATSVALQALLNEDESSAKQIVASDVFQLLIRKINDGTGDLHTHLKRLLSQDRSDAMSLKYSHPYFVYCILKSLDGLENIASEYLAKLNDDTASRDASAEINVIIEKIRHFNQEMGAHLISWISNEFHYQLTLSSFESDAELDEVSLISCLLMISNETTEHGFRPNEKMLALAAKVIFQSNRLFGYWNNGRHVMPTGIALFGSTTVELATALLEEPSLRRYLTENIDYIARILNYFVGGFDYDRPTNGWTSELQRGTDLKESWYGFLVFSFIFSASEKIRHHAANALLASFRKSENLASIPFQDLTDGGPVGYKAIMERSIVSPHIKVSKRVASEPEGKTHSETKYSAILFGPPGTGKTTIARSIAAELGVDLIEIGPGDFLRRGIDGVFAEGDDIFGRLMLADRSLILFDELDEWVTARTEDSDKVSRFLTTYMLPWLQRMRDQSHSIFLFATNRIRIFDSAIRRHGRFDLIVPIGPPNRDGKEVIIQKKLDENGLSCTKPGMRKILDLIEPRATRGDIIRGMELLMAESESPDFSKMAELLPKIVNSQLTVGETEWGEFQEDCNTYVPNIDVLLKP